MLKPAFEANIITKEVYKQAVETVTDGICASGNIEVRYSQLTSSFYLTPCCGQEDGGEGRCKLCTSDLTRCACFTNEIRAFQQSGPNGAKGQSSRDPRSKRDPRARAAPKVPSGPREYKPLIPTEEELFGAKETIYAGLEKNQVEVGHGTDEESVKEYLWVHFHLLRADFISQVWLPSFRHQPQSNPDDTALVECPPKPHHGRRAHSRISQVRDEIDLWLRRGDHADVPIDPSTGEKVGREVLICYNSKAESVTVTDREVSSLRSIPGQTLGITRTPAIPPSANSV